MSKTTEKGRSAAQRRLLRFLNLSLLILYPVAWVAAVAWGVLPLFRTDRISVF